MKSLQKSGPGLILLFVASGCGGGPEAKMKEQLAAKNEMTAILASIKDEASADAAIPKLEKAADRFFAATNALANKMSEADMKNYMEQYHDAHMKEIGGADSKTGEALKKALDAAPNKKDQILAAYERHFKR